MRKRAHLRPSEAGVIGYRPGRGSGNVVNYAVLSPVVDLIASKSVGISNIAVCVCLRALYRQKGDMGPLRGFCQVIKVSKTD
jgi:hypothetical protein